MKEIWYQHVIDNKDLWCHGFTLKRLQKIKDVVLSDEHILFDLLLRHSANVMSPQQMKEKDSYAYKHCVDNFACNIAIKMREQKLIN
jgi:hypothetical protein